MIYNFFNPYGGLNAMSDNYVTGDNIYLRELQNFFFQTLGMMSITHYGAIGDGRRDNYGPIQVAIDDAKRRGLSYIYVPFGRYIYTGEIYNNEGITFIGNPHAHIVNIRTGEEIPIEQFGVMERHLSAITGRFAQDYELRSDDEEQIPIEDASWTRGLDFVLEDGAITITKTANVKINMNLRVAVTTNSSDEWTVILYKNDDTYAFATVLSLPLPESGTAYRQVVVTPFYLYLKQGDKISLKVKNKQGETVTSGYITIEEV